MLDTLKKLSFVLLFFIMHGFVSAQTTGKIAGRVIDRDTGDPLMGTNVYIEDLGRGDAADVNGEFFIINLPPGNYTLIAKMMGYQVVRTENVKVSVNRTTNVDIEMNKAVIEGETVVIQADRLTIKKDQTSSIRNVSSEDIEKLPVENIGEVVAMQPGVVRGHFRGGRSDEVAYMVEGIDVTETFGGSGSSVDLEPEAIKDVEVITGTFNAEYGQAMSGIVNVVTKEGGKKFHGGFSASCANYLTPHKDIFIGLKDTDFDRNQDYKFQLGGPIWKDKIKFFTNIRYRNNKGHLNGIHRFNVDDYSFFMVDDPEEYYSEHTGDSSYVPMNCSKNISYLGKLTVKPFMNLKASLLYVRNDDEWEGYSHVYKYNPYGRSTSYREANMYSLNINHLISKRLFYELKLSYIDNYGGNYKYKNPLDSRYVHEAYHNISGPSFYTGGESKGHSVETAKRMNSKFDMTWQIDKHHSLKAGFQYIKHNLKSSYYSIQNKYKGSGIENEYHIDEETLERVYDNYAPAIYPDSSIFSDVYHVRPYEFSGYLQDKMEFDEMVINFGVRYDYFNPNRGYPSQRRNPANQLDFPEHPEKESTYPMADPKIQISPRLGFAYQIGEMALLHFSYGHFFQMPAMYSLYTNNSFRVAPTDYVTTMGNSKLNAQKTVQYEIGLWQELSDGMGIEVALFYRNIYELLSTKVVSTYNQIEYGLYCNKDYGNVKGLEVKYDVMVGNISAYFNYTLQYTKGNADNPTQTFTRAGNSMDPIAKLIPMSWDQRHTLNASINYSAPNFNITVTSYYNSGTPYSWTPIDESRLAFINLYPNNSWQPGAFNVDLMAVYFYNLNSGVKLKFMLNVYNLLDKLNESWVYSTTGRAYTDIIRETDRLSHRSDFNDYEDIIHNPTAYSTPRLIKFGVGISF